MKMWTKTAGLIFVAAASVYSSRVIAAKAARPATPTGKSGATDVKLLEQQSDPFAATAPASASPATAPAEELAPAPEEARTGGPAAPVQMNADGTFSLNITSGADLVEQLRVIGYQAQMSVIPSKDVHGVLPAIDLYDVTVHEALDALLHANGFAWREKGKFIYVYSAKEIADMEKAARVANTEVFHLYYTPAANAVNMIKPVLSGEAQVSFTTPPTSGLESGTKDIGGNSHATDDVLVISDYPENLDRVRKILKDIDRRPQQILIEATILRAALSDDNALGVDFNIVGGVDFASITHSNGQITGAGLPTGPDAFQHGVTNSSVGSGNSFSGSIPNGFKVGVVTDNLSVFLAALEGVTNTTVLANPKVLALNKQKGEVIVGRKDGYITTTVTESSQTQTVEFLDTGTRLIFRPYIGDDGYIRMEIHPEDSSGGLTSANLPYKITTEVTSNIMVKDGRTILIGGLFRESSDTTRAQVPFFGNLPLAGYLFKNQRDRTTREEVIILLTPHIVKDDSVFSELSEQQMKEAEKLRVGVRQGMMLIGRERLAELNYEWAVQEMNKPNPDRRKALWNLDAATNLNPTFPEAINMKQELTGREITMSDNSTARSFVRRMILADHAPATQPVSEAVPTTQAVQAAGPATAPSAAEVRAAANGSGKSGAWGWSTVWNGTKRLFGWRGDENAVMETTVTELPMDEVPGSGAAAGPNK